MRKAELNELEDFNIYEEEEEETIGADDADIDDDGLGGSEEGGDSSTQDQGGEDNLDQYADLSYEELVEKLQEKDRKINKIVGDLRSKGKKAQQTVEPQKKQQADDESPDDGDKDGMQAVLAKLEQLEQRIEKGSGPSLTELQSEAMEEMWDSSWGQDYAPENDVDGENLSKLQAEFKLLLERSEAPKTKEEVVTLLKRAHYLANPDQLDAKPMQQRKPNAADAANVGGSSERNESGGTRLTARQLELAQKFGNDPNEVYKQS